MSGAGQGAAESYAARRALAATSLEPLFLQKGPDDLVGGITPTAAPRLMAQLPDAAVNAVCFQCPAGAAAPALTAGRQSNGRRGHDRADRAHRSG